MELPDLTQYNSGISERQDLFERIVARFECDWFLGQATQWQDYLPDDLPLRLMLEVELPLVAEELQRRHPHSAEGVAAVKPNPASGQVQPPENSTRPESCTSTKPDAIAGMATQNASLFVKGTDEGSFTQPDTIPVRFSTCFGTPVRQMRGGLGDIWIVPEQNLGRSVVLKQLQSRWIGNVRAEQAFLREGQITSQLEHPGIVPVHAAGKTQDGRPFYSMRYVEGETLREAICKFHSESPSSLPTLRKLLGHFISVCRTVAYAHNCGVLHRDLKPENIVIGAFGQTIVLDWGLAKRLDSTDVPAPAETTSLTGLAAAPNSTLCTQQGDVIGTPAYMSPEQARGDVTAISIRTDVFGLGAILYTILYGSPPFESESGRQSTTVTPSGVVDFPKCHVIQWFASGPIAICRKALSANPEDRYHAASLLADELEDWMSGESISVQRQPTSQRLMRWAAGQRTLAAATILFAFLSAAVSVVGFLGIQRERTERLLAAQAAESNEVAMRSAADYITKVFQSAEPMGFDDLGFVPAGNADAKVALRRILESGYALVDSHYDQRPAEKSDILLAMGHSFRGLAEYARAKELLSESLELRNRLYGQRGVKSLECQYHLARLAYESGDYASAESAFRNVIREGQPLEQSAELLVADSQFHLAWLLYYQPLGTSYPQFDPGSIEESKRLFKNAITTRERLLGKNHPSVGLAHAGYAAACFNDPTQIPAAMAAVTKAMEVFRAHGQSSTLGNFLVEYLRAERLRSEGNYDEACELYCELRETINEHLGSNHPVFVMHLWNMAGFYNKFGKLEEAEQTIHKIRELARGLSGFRSSKLHLDGLRQYAEQLQTIRPDDAKVVLQEALRFASERPSEHIQLTQHLEQLLGNGTRASDENTTTAAGGQ